VLALAGSIYPDEFPNEYSVFCADNDPETVIVDLDVPRLDEVPQHASYRFDVQRDEIVPHPLAQGALADLYDGVVYQTGLRTLHEAFECDYAEVVKRVTVNLFATKVNPATGTDERICVATCEATREQFSGFDLARVDPRECFRALKGLTAKRPSALQHVQPLRTIEVRSDEDGLSIELASEHAPAPNLLLIDPIAFEELVGSLFQRVFEREGATVQVTKASHDGGVDVVVDDPDEIKGGKIVIQVKRYRGVVAPGFVRDLYGTMLNEGASKGILVATGHFGPEAREFAQDKPITLIDSEGLLKMLAEHGYRYRLAE
jgi:restriction system protein